MTASLCLSTFEQNNSKGSKRILMKISGIVDNRPKKTSLNFGDAPDSSYYFSLIHFIMVYITKQTVKVSEQMFCHNLLHSG